MHSAVQLQQGWMVQHHSLSPCCTVRVRRLPQRHGFVSAAGHRVTRARTVDRDVLPAWDGNMGADMDGERGCRTDGSADVCCVVRKDGTELDATINVGTYLGHWQREHKSDRLCRHRN